MDKQTVAVRDHQGKAGGIISALRNSKLFQLVDFGEPADILLIDHDGTEYYRNIIHSYKRIGSRVLLYPHGAEAHLTWDGIHEPHPDVDGFLAMSEGQKENMLAYGYPKQIAVTGWHWCNIGEFIQFNRNERIRVLYAPIHALNSGWCHPDIKELNQLVLERLVGLPNIDLTVRYVGDMEACGIERVNGVKYQKGFMQNGTAAIQLADVVVSFGTFSYLAVATGKPTLFYRQDIPFFISHDPDDYREAESWELYADDLRFPLDIMENRLGEANTEPVDWKNKYIGTQMVPERLEDAICQIIGIQTATR